MFIYIFIYVKSELMNILRSFFAIREISVAQTACLKNNKIALQGMVMMMMKYFFYCEWDLAVLWSMKGVTLFESLWMCVFVAGGELWPQLQNQDENAHGPWQQEPRIQSTI